MAKHNFPFLKKQDALPVNDLEESKFLRELQIKPDEQSNESLSVFTPKFFSIGFTFILRVSVSYHHNNEIPNNRTDQESNLKCWYYIQ